MIATNPNHPDDATHPTRVVVVDIGNSSTDVALWTDNAVSHRRDSPTGQTETLELAVRHCAGQEIDDDLTTIAIASVVPASLDALANWIRGTLNIEPLIVGRQIPLPMPVTIPRPEAVGVDRICAAAAAYNVKREPCVVVDFGTAITIDVVDGEGAFIGGAIAPGLYMQAKALHRDTAALPAIAPAIPTDVIGRDTTDAMRSGIVYGTAGAVRHIVERFAEQLGRWPPVVATGGDAALMTDLCAIFDDVVPDLCLMGVGLAYQKWLDAAVNL